MDKYEVKAQTQWDNLLYRAPTLQMGRCASLLNSTLSNIKYSMRVFMMLLLILYLDTGDFMKDNRRTHSNFINDITLSIDLSKYN